MSYPKKVRLHRPGGKIVVEPFARFCRANGGLTRDQGALLLSAWEREGAVRRRPDGGYDVLKARPRLSPAQVAAVVAEEQRLQSGDFSSLLEEPVYELLEKGPAQHKGASS